MNRLIIILVIAAIGCNQAEKKPENKVVTPVQTAAVQPGLAKPERTLPSMDRPVAQPPAEPKVKPPAKPKVQPPVQMQETFNPTAEVSKLSAVMKHFESKPQVFTVSSAKPTEVKGQKGTLVSVDPVVLETTDGKPVSGDIEVELKECVNATDFLLANAPTVSNGQLLVSGGAYYINMTAAGSALRIRHGKTISVRFPKRADENMELFYGERNAAGQMNWLPAGQPFVQRDVKQTKALAKPNKPDTIATWTRFVPDEKGTRLLGIVVKYPDGKTIRQWDGRPIFGDTTNMTTADRKKYDEEMADFELKQQQTDEFYSTMNLSNLGWINCDRFLNVPKTEIIAQFPPEDSLPAAVVFVVFRNINSMISGTYVKAKDRSRCTIPDMPVGYKAQLISYAFKKDKMVAMSAEITIEKDKPFTVHMKPVKSDELEKMLASR